MAGKLVKVVSPKITRNESAMPKPSIPTLYSSLHRYLLQRITDRCDSRLTNLIWLMMGMFSGASVQLPLVARKLPLIAQKWSTVKRLSRWLDNGVVRVRQWYEPTARELLSRAASGGQVRLILDGTKVANGHQLLMVALAYQRRALPIAWTWVKGGRGHSTTTQQVALLSYLRGLIPPNSTVTLIADGEFGTGLLMDYLEHWGWQYVLRLACDTQIMRHCPGRDDGRWQRIDTWLKVGQPPLFLQRVSISKAYPQGGNVLIFQESGQSEAWFLATNLPTGEATLQTYRLRMWIEEMFGDMKGHGFDLESSHLAHFLRLSRLTLAVCLLYVWLMLIGKHVEHHRLWSQIDRIRGDLSLFRWGWDFLERRLALSLAPPDVDFSLFCSVSGG